MKRKTTAAAKTIKYSAVARLVGLFGVTGELKCRTSSAGEGTVVAGREFFLDASGDRSVVVSRVRRHHRQLIVSLRGVESIEAARPFVGAQLHLSRDAITLREGEFLDDDLIGLRLLDENEKQLGVIARVEHYPAQDCLVIEPGNVLVPLVRAFIQEINLSLRYMRVTLPPGLIDIRQAEEA